MEVDEKIFQFLQKLNPDSDETFSELPIISRKLDNYLRTSLNKTTELMEEITNIRSSLSQPLIGQSHQPVIMEVKPMEYEQKDEFFSFFLEKLGIKENKTESGLELRVEGGNVIRMDKSLNIETIEGPEGEPLNSFEIEAMIEKMGPKLNNVFGASFKSMIYQYGNMNSSAVTTNTNFNS